MNTKIRYKIILLLAALVLPLSWANGAASLQFTVPSVSGAPGTDVTISLQVVSDAAGINAVDYWLTQFAGASSGAFTITGTTRSTSQFPIVSADDSVAATNGTDTYSNTTGSPSSPDGINDNLINPRNGPDLGGTKSSPGTNFGAGTFDLGSFTIHINAAALPGLYTIQTFDYSGRGWSNTSVADQAFTSQGSININVVPEPATWSLIALGGLGAFGLNVLRARRRS